MKNSYPVCLFQNKMNGFTAKTENALEPRVFSKMIFNISCTHYLSIKVATFCAEKIAVL